MTFTVHEYEDDFALISHAGPPDRAGDSGDARRRPGAGRRADRADHAPSSRSCCRQANGAPTPPTTSSATPHGANATPTGRCGSAPRTPMRSGCTDGGRARITTAAGAAEATVEISEAMLPGHASLPNGFGVDFVDGDGCERVPGVAPNALTSSDWRDAYAGTRLAQARARAHRTGGAGSGRSHLGRRRRNRRQRFGQRRTGSSVGRRCDRQRRVGSGDRRRVGTAATGRGACGPAGSPVGGLALRDAASAGAARRCR